MKEPALPVRLGLQVGWLQEDALRSKDSATKFFCTDHLRNSGCHLGSFVFDGALQGEALNHFMLRSLKTVVMGDEERRTSSRNYPKSVGRLV